LVGTDDQLTIASYNVLNLDPKVEDRALVNGSGDIDDDLGEGQFDAIASQIVENLNSPDIISLQEIQDNDGAEQTDVVDASLTYQTLIDEIVAAGGPQYEFFDIPPEDDQSGGQPGGNIRVGYLYNPDRVDLIEGSGERLEDPNLADGDAFEDSRNPLAAQFLFNGQEVSIVNNHFTSKGGSSPLFGDIQPPINGGEEQREEQAQIVNDYVDEILADDPNANVVVLGDLNEFQFFSPIQVLKGGENPVLTNLTETLPEEERYSYIFEGNSQALDHILVSDNLAASAEYDPVHVNSEFTNQASDHDPVLSRFELAVPDDVLWGSTGSDELVGTQEDETLYGRAGDDTVAGGLGDDLIFGDEGEDVLRGDLNSRNPGGTVGGDDTIYGGAGNDRIGGKAGDDSLYGEAGDDQIYGDDGDDLLRGGLGNDTLVGDDFSGGNGSDTFVLALGEGTDTLLDFKVGDDLIALADGLMFEQLSITQSGSNTLIDSSDETLAILNGVDANSLIANASTTFSMI
jgi:Ca2+-binding RTX toxin-like protein